VARVPCRSAAVKLRGLADMPSMHMHVCACGLPVLLRCLPACFEVHTECGRSGLCGGEVGSGTHASRSGLDASKQATGVWRAIECRPVCETGGGVGLCVHALCALILCLRLPGQCAARSGCKPCRVLLRTHGGVCGRNLRITCRHQKRLKSTNAAQTPCARPRPAHTPAPNPTVAAPPFNLYSPRGAPLHAVCVVVVVAICVTTTPRDPPARQAPTTRGRQAAAHTNTAGAHLYT
jgi:hypothetical protein